MEFLPCVSNSTSEESTVDEHASHRQSPSVPPPPSKKRPAGCTPGGRKQVQKRVVPMAATDVEASCPPAPDQWAWRKYGQKPIKGSPYPRGYYRCSSSKGCPARKQVERSRTDPTVLLVTYTADHNHPWSLPKDRHNYQSQNSSAPAAASSPRKQPPEQEREDPPALSITSSSSANDPLDLAEEGFLWFDGGPQETTMLVSDPICGGALDDYVGMVELGGNGGVLKGEEEMFEGLGELPEWSVLFERGVVGRKAAAFASQQSGR